VLYNFNTEQQLFLFAEHISDRDRDGEAIAMTEVGPGEENEVSLVYKLHWPILWLWGLY